MSCGTIACDRPDGTATKTTSQPASAAGSVGVAHEVGVGPAEAREQLGDRRPGRGLRLGGDDIEIGMGRQQPQQLGTEIARRPDDRRLHGMTIL